MSLATRCPACQTVFRVVQDQLRVSEGWVRCGRCAEVFNALEHMVEVVRPAPPPAPVAPAPLAPPEVPAGTPDLSDPEARHDARGWGAPEPAPITTPPESELYDPLRHDERVIARAEADDAAAIDAEDMPASTLNPGARIEWPVDVIDEPRTADDADEVGMPPAFGETPPAVGEAPPAVSETPPSSRPGADGAFSAEALLDVRPGWRDEPAPVDAWAARATPGADIPGPAPGVAATMAARAMDRPAPDVAAAAEAANAEPAAPAALPSFVRQAERAERWQRPGVRRLLLALVLLGMAALGLQVLLTYRDIAAARWPLARLALEPMCRALGCRIEPPRWLDAVVVDSTGLSLIEGTSTYRLQVVLRNRSTLVLAPPSLDVSLKDAQGRLLVRRQLALRELGSPVAVLPAASDVTLQATLSLSGPAGEKTAVSSYTIEVFYP